MEGAQDLVLAVVPAQVVEEGRDSERQVESVLVWVQGAGQVPEPKVPESSLLHWAGGSPPRHY